MTEHWDNGPDEIEIDLRYYWYLLHSNWWLLALMTVVAGSVAFGVSYVQPKVYRAETTLLVDAGGTTGADDLGALRVSESLAQTYAELVSSREVLEETIGELGLSDSVRELGDGVNANPVGSTQLLRISAEYGNPIIAAAVANKLAEVLITEIESFQSSRYGESQANLQEQLSYLDTQIAATQEELDAPSVTTDERTQLQSLLGEYNRQRTSVLQSIEALQLSLIQSSSNVQQTERAVAPEGAIRPNPLRNAILGAVLGLMAAVGIILAREFLDDTINDPERMSEQIGIPIIGRIMNFDADNERLITIEKPRSPQAENFRSVRLNLDYASPDQELRSILITSAAPSEGKSTLASNLAIVMAQGGKHTMLIDGDMRRPKVHRIFDVPNMVGLSNLFLPSANGSMDSASATAVENLSVVSSGPLPPNPSELFYSRRAGEIIQNAENSSDMVIVDTPPIAAMTDATAIARHVDGVILAVRFGQTKRRVLDQAIDALKQVDARILGLVITDIGNRGNRYGNYYYNYRYGYSGYSVYYQDEETQEATGLRSRLRRKTKVLEE